ncbi:hypothetical protein NQ315_016651 [Exocentrus adspersus]|uniref:Major facilitator superfamily (MFS) profile domain-containing protein n=1 Tax=Exocentrus adspersus TaxID=1586481 RepID=A0AAV8VPJ5_9CUCU|nr:hypothetical protein NQ315_016651 [Exocentrus adspersus]
MESEHGSTDGKKHDQFTEEVVYVATENTKRDSQYLKFEDGEKHNDSCFLYLSAFTADLLAFASGCGMAWSSPAFATLTESNPYVNPLGQPVTPIQQSWIVALLFLGAAIGPIITAKLADSLGRKKCFF